MYLYRAVDSEGHTLEFFLSPTRDAEAAKRFFLKALRSTPRLVRLLKLVRLRSRWPKGQVRGVGKGDSSGQVAFIARLFGVVA